MNEHSTLERVLWVSLVLCSIGLLACSCYRAATLSFTHDESLSFAGFTWAPTWSETANNHLLNTWLMELCSKIFGNSELSLRLPNLSAHSLFLICTLLIIKRFDNAILKILGFAVLNINPFAFDFFSLARGYGLAMAFQILALYLVVLAFEEKKTKKFVQYLFFSTIAGALAALANFTFLNFYFPLLLICAWLLFSDESLFRFSLRNIMQSIILAAINGIFLATILIKALKLQRTDQLYFGGNSGFVADTIGSIVMYSLSASLNLQSMVSGFIVLIIGSFIFLIVLAGCLFIMRKDEPVFALLNILLVFAVALPVLQHSLLGTLFPMQRAALYYIPLYSATLLFALQFIGSSLRAKRAKVIFIAIIAATAVFECWNFSSSFNITSTFIWSYDKYDKQVLEIISKDRGQYFPNQTISMGISPPMEPALNFYRITRKYAWLETVTRNPINIKVNNYAYGFETDIQRIDKDRGTLLAAYPDIKTKLLRIDRSPGP
jgi:4-amino-4-deoxy-L-arabinose transferase-like glycosyltransferase